MTQTTEQIYYPKTIRFSNSDSACFFALLTQRALSQPKARQLFSQILETTIKDQFGIDQDNGLQLRRMFCYLERKNPEDHSYMATVDEVKKYILKILDEDKSGKPERMDYILYSLSHDLPLTAASMYRQGVAHDLFEGDDAGYKPSINEINQDTTRGYPQLVRESEGILEKLLA